MKCENRKEEKENTRRLFCLERDLKRTDDFLASLEDFVQDILMDMQKLEDRVEYLIKQKQTFVKVIARFGEKIGRLEAKIKQLEAKTR